MKSQSLSPVGIQALDDLVRDVYTDLSSATNTHFFVASRVNQQTSVANDVAQEIDVILDTVPENRLIIDSIAGSPVVYALWVRTPITKETIIRYIGHVVGTGARTRMINHFVRKHERTGAQLPNVRAALAAGNEVGVSFVAIDPPAVRLYVEEVLIRDKKPLWNIKSAERKQKASITSINT